MSGWHECFHELTAALIGRDPVLVSIRHAGIHLAATTTAGYGEVPVSLDDRA